MGQDWAEIANYPPQCSTKIFTPSMVLRFSSILRHSIFLDVFMTKPTIDLKRKPTSQDNGNTVGIAL